MILTSCHFILNESNDAKIQDHKMLVEIFQMWYVMTPIKLWRRFSFLRVGDSYWAGRQVVIQMTYDSYSTEKGSFCAYCVN